MLSGHCCDIVVLNVQSPRVNKVYLVKNSFYEAMEQVFVKFPKYHKKVLLGNFNAKVGGKPKIGIENLHEIGNKNGVRAVSVFTPTNFTVGRTMFQYRSIPNFTWKSPDGKTLTQIGHIVVDRRTHSSLLDFRSFRAADCDTDYYLAVLKVRWRLVVNKQRSHIFRTESFNLKN
jgi:hypothetical protein